MYICLVPFTVMFAYLEATDLEPGSSAVLISPTLPEWGNPRCLLFNYNKFGEDFGALRVLDQNAATMWKDEGKMYCSLLCKYH